MITAFRTFQLGSNLRSRRRMDISRNLRELTKQCLLRWMREFLARI